MADNVVVSAGTGTTIAADELTDGTLGSVKVQYVKLMDGTLDGSTKAAVGANGLAVNGNLATVNGTTVLVNTGAVGAGAQRVAVAVDSATVAGSASLPTGSNVIGHVIADSGSTTAVTQATAANLLASVGGLAASGASVSGNPILNGARAATANPTAVTDGQAVALMTDKLGKLISVGSIRTLRGMQETTITSSTAETTIVTAVASTFNDLYGLTVANSSATATKVTLKDSTSGTTRWVGYVPAGDMRGFILDPGAALPQATVNTNWTLTCTTSVASIDVSAFFIANT